MDALVVDTPDHRLTARRRPRRLAVPADAVRRRGGGVHVGHDQRRHHRRPCGRRRLRSGAGLVVPRRRRLRRLGHLRPFAAPEVRGVEQADSFILDPHKWLFTPFDCCALLYRDPELARATHTQDASYLDVIHTSDGEWNPSDYAYQLTRRARGLPLWFSLAVNGLEAYREAIEVAVSLARRPRS